MVLFSQYSFNTEISITMTIAKVVIIIPTYNEAAVIQDTLTEDKPEQDRSVY